MAVSPQTGAAGTRHVYASWSVGGAQSQAIITPACGLGLHGERQAALVVRLTNEIAERVHGQAVATRLTVGA